MSLCDPTTNTVITVTFFDQGHSSSLLAQSFKMTLPSISKPITGTPRGHVMVDPYNPIQPIQSPSSQNPIIKPIPINNSSIPLMTMSSISGAQTVYYFVLLIGI